VLCDTYFGCISGNHTKNSDNMNYLDFVMKKLGSNLIFMFNFDEMKSALNLLCLRLSGVCL
jgi:hypothetical protein